jgi:hypothetical protein
MEKTWASGAIELLRHADSHIDLESAFDKRIAFISIDNCVETCVRSFLSLPAGKSGVKVSREKFEEVSGSFPRLVELLFKHVADRLTGIDPGDIEHYHRIRNKLYHEGTGLSVDEQYLLAYRSIAVLLLQNLFGVAHVKNADQPPKLDLLILNWNRIEQNVRTRLQESGTDHSHTFKWEMAFQAGILTPQQVNDLTELRMVRNRLVHSQSVDPDDVAYWVRKSEQLLDVLGTKRHGG